jgi:hypothetical protein
MIRTHVARASESQLFICINMKTQSRLTPSNLLRLCLLTSIATLGCDGLEQKPSSKPPATAHNHDHGGHDHKHAETFADVVKEIEGFQTTIKQAFEKKSPDDAHDALHEIGHSIELVVSLAQKQKVADADMPGIKQAAEDLMDAFGAIDAKMHSLPGKDYQEVSSKIDAAMQTLKASVK